METPTRDREEKLDRAHLKAEMGDGGGRVGGSLFLVVLYKFNPFNIAAL